MQPSEIIKRIVKAILFLVILMAITIFLDMAFEMDENATEEMLTRYSTTKDINMVFVGNSAGEMLDDAEYSDISGFCAFNMCTPSQSLSVSFKNIKMAASHHKIREAVLFITMDSVNNENYDGIDHLYDRTVDSSSPIPVKIKNAIKRNIARSFRKDTIGNEQSINVWVPWENETMHGWKNVKDNVTRRFSRLVRGQRLGYRIAFDLNSVVYETYPGAWTDEDSAMFDEDVARIGDLDIDEWMIGEDKLGSLADICIFCRDNGIGLKVIVTPHRTDYYDRYQGYRAEEEELSAYLDDFVSKRGFIYYNTEDDPKLHGMLPDEYFYDWEHVTSFYRDKSTEYLAGIIDDLNTATGD